jgi:branched-chain amino acid transport system substrate-binding protein
VTNAMIAYQDAYRLSSDKRLDSLVLNSIEAAVGKPRSMAFEEISLGAFSEERKCRLAVSVGRGLLKQKNYQSVPAVLSGCTGPEVSALLAEADRLLREEPQIGIALPLSGELQKYGESLLEGAMLMVDDFARVSGRNLTPVIYDTRGESVEAARIARRLAARGVTAFIGPLTSEETAVTSAALSCSDLPMIAPAASQSGLTELSPNCYQLQPTLDLQGARMAEFAIRKMKFDSAVIITPTVPENLRMARAFSRRFTELGGKILGIEYFRARDTDFGPLLLDAKALAMGNLSDSLIFVNEKGDTLEPREVPINLECLYIPADAVQLAQLLPQVNFYNIKTTFLGSEGWGEKSVYGLGRDIIKECYFTSGRMSGDNPVSAAFAAAFQKKYEREPGYLEALGYDAMALICQAFSSENNTRLEISHYLSTVTDYQGAAGSISFDANRENTFMPVYTIISGNIKMVEF